MRLIVLLIVVLTALPTQAVRAASGPAIGVWLPTGSMSVPRSGPFATPLFNGKVLVAGGCSCFSMDLYNPRTGIWSATSPITVSVQSATTLLSDKVLLTGEGQAAVYDPRTNTSVRTGPMLINGLMYYTATLLRNGTVLIVGGQECNAVPFYCGPTASAEVYDPGTNAFTETGAMMYPRMAHTATLLPNGQVLVAGGLEGCDPLEGVCIILNNAELYDPTTGTWTPTGAMNVAREGQQATRLANGGVLVTGGNWCAQDCILAAAEVYNPTTGTWTLTSSMHTPRYGHTATLLPNGKVLVAGGQTCFTCPGLTSAELWNPLTGLWSVTASMSTGRYAQTATLLYTGLVLVAGGGSLSSAELFLY